jgi:hypothetical protein
MIRTTNLEEKLKNLKEVMGDDYDESHDVIDEDDEEEEHDPNVKPKIELISTQTIQQYEQQATKLTWLKKKLVKIRARGDHRRQQDLERLAEIEAREEEEELAASEAIERENKEPSAVSSPPLTLSCPFLPTPLPLPPPDDFHYPPLSRSSTALLLGCRT